jgi:hypothetical protein
VKGKDHLNRVDFRGLAAFGRALKSKDTGIQMREIVGLSEVRKR